MYDTIGLLFFNLPPVLKELSDISVSHESSVFSCNQSKWGELGHIFSDRTIMGCDVAAMAGMVNVKGSGRAGFSQTVW